MQIVKYGSVSGDKAGLIAVASREVLRHHHRDFP